MKLPESFLREVEELQGPDGLRAYLEAMERPYVQGLRANTAKVTPDRLRTLLPEGATEDMVPWCPAGFYLREDTAPMSASPYYAAGLFYLQEPSAMAPAALLPVEPGDRILDLCAAPGGKSTALGARLEGSGLLVANDISASRAKALLKNLEMFGIGNAVVMSESPHRLAERFEGFFDKVLVDAPCSGEGMFRKDPSIIRNWMQYGSSYYAKIQREILPYAARMTAPGGMLLYSTCTYSVEEDEGILLEFLREHPDWSIEPVSKAGGMADGVTRVGGTDAPELAGAARFWPHLVRGEGHFAALLRRGGSSAGHGSATGPQRQDNAIKCFKEWAADELTVPVSEIIPEGAVTELSGDKLYAVLLDPERRKGLRILRPGLLLGEIAHDRFEPSQALAMMLRPDQVRQSVSYGPEDERTLRYLKGETLTGDYPDGWILVNVSGYPLGWGKASGGLLKNKYLKSWRRMK
ncbi:MAG: RsmF rRNA methyltransferase first C-terminal domain-containing protein [Firmicutes bacterium]|nr:RsmF rRNA methyltransferase first C-terminal domain-containing protein [Bacillota bacterium]